MRRSIPLLAWRCGGNREEESRLAVCRLARWLPVCFRVGGRDPAKINDGKIQPDDSQLQRLSIGLLSTQHDGRAALDSHPLSQPHRTAAAAVATGSRLI
jgi:hypothetical protein